MNRRRRRRVFRRLEVLLWCLAVLAMGAYAYVYLDRSVYQAYREWAFDRSLEGKPAPALGFLLHSLVDKAHPSEAPPPDDFGEFAPRRREAPPRRTLEPEALIGRIEIPRLGIRAMIVHGTSDRALRRAVGHIEGTAVPGEPGNSGIAGHRDTFFRELRGVRKGDLIRIKTLEATYSYSIDSIRIVDPEDTWVLNASAAPALTLVTCYPFDYIGTAPRRYIVHARQVASDARQPAHRSSA
jgi:LPXTG-site transpeptidase (sortase) family protein